ncbi:SET and MYND domain-containing protein 4-like [Sitodiplosis mosellana]|uniref:SET and MYND domain-containing protein 4-like n=1 Tax=Sitodiplosis mosellana TaxID=263140 RepID=UPI002443EAFA|nr:SET and MYND domain-containing protein 4-like [Sitodiplosis mosellana]
MDNLWKKDTGKTGHGYVDLFTPLMCLNASLNELDSIEKLMHSMELGELPQIQKDNQQSTEWRLKGNTLFGQQKWEEAAICYNKSLCFAEVGTENVALAYSNRSACLFRVHMYNEVLIDIDLAIRAKLPAHLLPKLEQRKKDTLKLMSIIKRKEESKPKLSYIADKNFPCMANVVDIKYNEEFGRHLAAKQDIPADKVVLVEDILRVADNPWECHSCSKICMNCIACPNCPDIMFCGVDCINKCKTHNFECGTFFPNLQVSDRFLIKSLLFAITTFPNVDSLMQFVEAALLERPETLPTSMRDPESKYHFFFKLSTSAPYPLGSTVANMAYMYVNNLPKEPNRLEIIENLYLN